MGNCTSIEIKQVVNINTICKCSFAKIPINYYENQKANFFIFSTPCGILKYFFRIFRFIFLYFCFVQKYKKYNIFFIQPKPLYLKKNLSGKSNSNLWSKLSNFLKSKIQNWKFGPIFYLLTYFTLLYLHISN